MWFWKTLSATAARKVVRVEGLSGVVTKPRWEQIAQTKSNLTAVSSFFAVRNNVSETSWAEHTTRKYGANVRQLAEGQGASSYETNSFGGFLNLKSVLAVSAAAAAVQTTQGLEVESEAAQKEEEVVVQVLRELPTEPITLYSYEVCPFCNKLRAFLDYNDIPYKVVEVNPLTKAEIKGMKKNKTGKLKVPIVGLPGETEEQQLVESDDIINAFENVLPKNKKGGGGGGGSWFGSKGAEQSSSEEVDEWRTWVNDRFVHVLTINIYRNVEESFETFDYITDKGNFDFVAREAARYGGAGIMYFVSNYSIKKKRNLPGDERTHLYEDVAKWVKALNGRDFLGGKKPNLADLSVFGVIRTIEGFQTFKDMMKNTEIGPWYARMVDAVGASSRVNP